MTETVFGFLFLLVAHAIAGIYSAPLKYSKRKTYIIWGTWVVLQCGLLFYTEYVLTDLTQQFFLGFILSLIGQYVIYFLTTKGRLTQRIFTILTYSLFFCIFMAVFTMVKGTFPELSVAAVILIHVLMLAAVMFYFLRYVCPLCGTSAMNISTGWGPLILVNIVFLITVILSSVFPVRLEDFNQPSVMTFIFICVSVMSVYPVIFSNIYSLSEASAKRETERQNKLLLAQIEAESAQLAAESQVRHDRRHHNLVMLEFANNNDIESVREYLKGLVESDSEVGGEKRYCENMTVGTVLSVYERRARENGVLVNISANAGRDLKVLPKDLVIVVANLFENAMNATAKLKGSERHIDIYIKEDAHRLVIKMENTCKPTLVFDEFCFGVGIHSVIATVSKYDGMYDFTAEDGIFSAKISLNLK